MNGINRAQVVGIVQRALVDLKAEVVVQEIADLFPAPARPFLIGGFVRDAVLRTFRGIHSTPRDLDFVVFDLESDQLFELLKNLGCPQLTTLGGAKVKVGGWSVDLWTPSQQIEIAGGQPRECTPQQLLNYSTLTIDAVMFDHIGEDLYEQDFFDAISDRTIESGKSSKWIPKWAPFHLAHTASVWSSTRFELSSRVLSRIVENNSPLVREQAIRYLKNHKKIQNARTLIEELTYTAQETQIEQVSP